MATMEDYGLKQDGYHAMSFSDAQDVIKTVLKQGDQELDLSDESTNAVIFNSVANVMEANSQEIQTNISNKNVLYADGVSLDGIGLQGGVSRRRAENSWTYLSITGDVGTVIPTATLATNRQGDLLINLSEQTISLTDNYCTSALITIGDVVAGHEYKITITNSSVNQHSVSYSSVDGDDAEDVINGIYDALASDNTFNSIANISKNENNTSITITSKTQPSGTFTIELDELLVCQKATISVQFVANEAGPVSVVAGSVSLKELISGVDEATNITDGVTGRLTELDAPYRQRIMDTPTNEFETLEAIRAALINADIGVTYAKAVNTTIGQKIIGEQPVDIVAIEAIVTGGSDNAIAQTIFDTKEASAYTTGNTTGIAVDTNGLPVQVRFTRPVNKYIWVKVNITQDSEATLPINYSDIIKQAVMSYGTSLGIGDDVNIVYLQSAIANAMQGLGSLQVETAETDTQGATPTYQQSNIALEAREAASFSETRIDVLMAE